jgi:hypothetical protein
MKILFHVLNLVLLAIMVMTQVQSAETEEDTSENLQQLIERKFNNKIATKNAPGPACPTSIVVFSTSEITFCLSKCASNCNYNYKGCIQSQCVRVSSAGTTPVTFGCTCYGA